MAIYRELILFRIACDPPLRLHSGFGDFAVPGDAVDDAGALYRGAGTLIDIPTIHQLVNGQAERIDVTVSGVSAETQWMALSESRSVRHAEARIGTVALDEAYQVVGNVEWEWRGRADTVETELSAGDSDRQRTIGISIGSAGTGRSRPSFSFFTAAEQRRRSATDAFCDNVAGISRGTTRRFGPSDQ